jgi:excisionase family DNA binding protein
LKRALSVRRSVDAFTKASRFALDGRPLSARALADLCGVELKTVHNWVLEGRLEHFRTPGRHLRFQRAAVQRFLLSCGYEAPSETDAKVTAVVVKGGSSAALRTVLQGLVVMEVEDLHRALIVAGRSEPALLVVDLTPRRPIPDASALQALARLTPAVRVALFAKSQRRVPLLYGAQFVDGVAKLLALVRQLTQG